LSTTHIPPKFKQIQLQREQASETKSIKNAESAQQINHFLSDVPRQCPEIIYPQFLFEHFSTKTYENEWHKID
jgi:hypothetical protein